MTGTIQNRGPQPRTAPVPQGQQRTATALLAVSTRGSVPVRLQVVKPCRDVENVEDMFASAAGIAPTLSSTRSTNLHGTNSLASPATPRRPAVGTARGLRLSRFARLFPRLAVYTGATPPGEVLLIFGPEWYNTDC